MVQAPHPPLTPPTHKGWAGLPTRMASHGEGTGVRHHQARKVPGILVRFPKVALEGVRDPSPPPLDDLNGYLSVEESGRAPDPKGMSTNPIDRHPFGLGGPGKEVFNLGCQDRGTVGPPEKGPESVGAIPKTLGMGALKIGEGQDGAGLLPRREMIPPRANVVLVDLGSANFHGHLHRI